MGKETAFGKNSDYQNFAKLGRTIAATRNKVELEKQIQLLTGKNVIQSQRAATVLHHASNLAPELLIEHLDGLIYTCANPIHNSGPRMAMRLFGLIEIPMKYAGKIVTLAFQYLENPQTPVAIKVNAIYVIANQAKIYPELKSELETCIANCYDRESPSVKACIRKISRELNLIIK